MTAQLGPQTIIVEPPHGWVPLRLKELWIYRELIFFLTWRDLKVRYKQTLLGASWAILKPVLSMVVFSIFFGNLAKVPSDGIPYPIFNFTALLPWELFANALNVASRSLVVNSNMITKVYFPRIILPLSSILAGVVDFAIGFCADRDDGLLPHHPHTGHLDLAALFLLTMITALGVGLWLSALNVLYRDVGYVMPFLTQFWMFITPVVYSTSLLPEKWRTIYWLNPMAGVVDGFRWALLGIEESAPGPMLAISAAIAVLILISGLYYFRRMERLFADRV